MQQMDFSHVGPSGRTSEEPSTPTTGPTSLRLSKRWPTRGRWSLNGPSWTRSSSGSPSGGSESLPSLASILEPLSDALIPYCLSQRAARGILDRAERRGLRLEEPLRTALQKGIPTYMDDGGVVVYAGGKPAEIVNSLTSRQGQRMPSRLDMSNVAVFIKGRRATAHPDDADTWHTEGPAPTLNGFDNTGPVRATVIAVHMTQDPINGPVSPAMGTTSGGMGVLDPRGNTPVVRRLTPRECERLMGWPDDWTAQGVTPEGKAVKISDNQRGKMIGNGVATPVARFIAQAIMEVEA